MAARRARGGAWRWNLAATACAVVALRFLGKAGGAILAEGAGSTARTFAAITGFHASGRHLTATADGLRLRGRTSAWASASSPGFDPWTALGIAPDAGKDEARLAYKKLIRKYHPDIDPSPEAAAKFQDIVKAEAIITGEDRELDTATLLSNAVENLRADVEFSKQKAELLKKQAAEEEQRAVTMQAQMEKAQAQKDKVTGELGLYGGVVLGGVLGFLVPFVGVPIGAAAGAVLGLSVKDRNDATGQVVRSTGQVAKGIVEAVGSSAKDKK